MGARSVLTPRPMNRTKRPAALSARPFTRYQDSKMNTIRRIALLSTIALPLAALSMSAQMANPTADMPQFIRVTGEAVAATSPDEVMLDIGVTTQARTAQDAASENARKVETVLAALKKVAGASAATRTVQYGLNPDYRQVREENQPPLIQSYTAYNMIRVRTADMARIGGIIDAAIAAGANTIQSVQFAVNETNAVRNQVLAQATANAMAKAESMAAALKMKVRRIISVDEGAPMMPYRGYGGDMRAMEASTVIDPGSVDVRGVVTLTVEISA